MNINDGFQLFGDSNQIIISQIGIAMTDLRIFIKDLPLCVHTDCHVLYIV